MQGWCRRVIRECDGRREEVVSVTMLTEHCGSMVFTKINGALNEAKQYETIGAYAIGAWSHQRQLVSAMTVCRTSMQPRCLRSLKAKPSQQLDVHACNSGENTRFVEA